MHRCLLVGMDPAGGQSGPCPRVLSPPKAPKLEGASVARPRRVELARLTRAGLGPVGGDTSTSRLPRTCASSPFPGPCLADVDDRLPSICGGIFFTEGGESSGRSGSVKLLTELK